MKRTPIRRISAKRLKKLGGKPVFSTISSAPKRIRKKPRKKSEFARIYGGKKRIEFVKSLPCSACGVVGYSENAHVLGNGGMGRKGDYTSIAPLCGPRWSVGYLIPGCHTLFDQSLINFARRFPDFDPLKAAAETENLWRAWQESQR